MARRPLAGANRYISAGRGRARRQLHDHLRLAGQLDRAQVIYVLRPFLAADNSRRSHLDRLELLLGRRHGIGNALRTPAVS